MARTMAGGRTHAGIRYPDIDPAVVATVGGRAFTLDEAFMALRWADLVRERGYRLTISHRFLEADEVLEVHILTCSLPVSRLHKGSRVIWSTDCLGHVRPFASLADALLALMPLSKRDRRTMLKAARPAWLESLPLGGGVSDPVACERMPWLRWMAGLLAQCRHRSAVIVECVRPWQAQPDERRP